MAYEPVNDFFISEFCEDCTVPIYWNDTDILEDDEQWGDTVVVQGIFSNPYERLDLGVAGIDSVNPAVLFKTSDVPGAIGGDTITIGGTVYEVGTPKPDGTGLTMCELVLS